MAFKLVSAGGANVEPTLIEIESTGSVAVGDVLAIAQAESTKRRVKRAASTTTIYTLFGVAANNVASATGLALVIPINNAQLWEADTTAASAVNQLLCANNLDTYAVLSNSNTLQSTTLGLFTIYALRGATTDNKVIGAFTKLNYGN